MQTMILLTAKAVTKFVWNFTWVFFFGKVAVKDAMVTNRKATLLFFCFIGSVFYSDAASVVVTVEEEKPKAAKKKNKVANDGVSK